jgi:hypothetical protein
MNTTTLLSCFCWCVAISDLINAQQSPSTDQSGGSISPDKLWKYSPGNDDKPPQIVNVATKQNALNLDENCDIGCTSASLLWAPNSKRFAFVRGDGKERLTAVYQLREDKWVQLKAFGEDDEMAHRAYNIVKAQGDRKGLPKKTFLHQQWWTVEADRWIDSNTLTIHTSLAMRVHRNDGEDMGLGYGSDHLFTLKFDDAGNWKIVKSHEMSGKESEKFHQQD